MRGPLGGGGGSDEGGAAPDARPAVQHARQMASEERPIFLWSIILFGEVVTDDPRRQEKLIWPNDTQEHREPDTYSCRRRCGERHTHIDPPQRWLILLFSCVGA